MRRYDAITLDADAAAIFLHAFCAYAHAAHAARLPSFVTLCAAALMFRLPRCHARCHAMPSRRCCFFAFAEPRDGCGGALLIIYDSDHESPTK